MESRQLLIALERAAESVSWFDFVSRIDELLNALGLKQLDGDSTQPSPTVDSAADDLNRTLLEYWEQLEGRTAGYLLAECYGLCVSPEALRTGMSLFDGLLERRMVRSRLAGDSGESLADAYLASLAKLGRILRESDFLFWLERWRRDISGGSLRLRTMAAKGVNQGAIPLPAPFFFSHPGVPDLRSGDCLFRDLNVTGLSDLGHVGLYLGCPDPEADYFDWEKHLLIEMTTAGCVVSNVADFFKAGPFWGFYGADLSASQRRKLVGLAWAHVGLCVYARFTNYKNDAGLQFRCDGFIEYCHEKINVVPALPVHRGGGLFEEDSWRSLSPSALRNCLPYKR